MMKNLAEVGMILFTVMMTLALGAFWGRELTLMEYDKQIKRLHQFADLENGACLKMLGSAYESP